MIELEGVSKRFRGGAVLKDVDLCVGEGEVVVVSGASGAGKTTLLGLTYAAVRPDGGAVKIFGRDLSRLRRSSIALLRRRVGVIPQEIALFDHRTAMENVAVTLEVRGESPATIAEHARGALDMVALTDAARQTVDRLSTGQRRRVTIARALVGEPAALVADEPTGDLDSGRIDEFCGLLEELRGRGCACLISSNDPLVLEIGALCGWRQLELFAGTLREVDRTAAAVEVVPGDFDVPDTDQIELPEGASNVVPLSRAKAAGAS